MQEVTNSISTSSARLRTGTGFAFVQDGARAMICHDGQAILVFERNIFYAGHFRANDQVMKPGGEVEVAWVPLFSLPRGEAAVTEVEYQLLAEGDELALRLIPTQTRVGRRPLAFVSEIVTFHVKLENGSFVWRQTYEATFHKDVDTTPDAMPFFHFYRTHLPDNQPCVMVQYADPLPRGASGPAVPMTHDWIGQIEPYNGPDNYRHNWQRRYDRIIFQDPDGTFAWSDLTKRKWHYLTNDNRRSRPCKANGYLYVLKPDGEALEYLTEAPSHYHHVCEWGMDFHFWCDMGPFMRGAIIPAGTLITAATTARLVDSTTTAPLLASARAIELTPAERAIADRPAYEEPVNTFAVSALDRIDSLWWEATSEGCFWERQGGYSPGHGCLGIRTAYSPVGSWEAGGIGPSQWANPFVPGGRYRLSAWVKVDDLVPDPSQTQGPQLNAVFMHYDGPASGSPVRKVDCGWSASLVRIDRPLPTSIPWTRVELITSPCPSNVLHMTLTLRMHGRGIARFSDVRWQLLEPDYQESGINV